MNLRPTRTFISCLCCITMMVLLILSCSKDRDILLDAVLEENSTSIVEQDSTTTNSSEDENPSDEELIEDENVNEELENRTTIFPTSNDAYLQNGSGFDQIIVRLQENFRRSYLMFDLSQIDSIGGEITSARLSFHINTDDGNGIIKVYKGESNNWNEDNLSETSAPKIASELGQIEQVYRVEDKVMIDLDIEHLLPENSTLILEHEDGDDLAFASKENTTKEGPQLIVSYNAPISAEEILINEEQILEEDTTEEDTTEEDTTEEDTTEEDTTEEDTTEEDTTEEDTSEEDTTEEDTIEEDTTEEDTTETNAQPTAIAEASPSSGIMPLEVSFTGNKSSDDKSITSYNWNFKDGSSATTNNAVHTFTEAGSYEVILMVTDAEGLSSTDTVVITVSEPANEAPIAIATANVVSGIIPLNVNFIGSSSEDDEGIETYSWNFGDGSSSNSANPSHTFTATGTYTVELTVTDADGLSDKATVTITAGEPANEAPVALASADIINGYAPLQVNFTGSNSIDDNGIVSYFWNLSESSSTSANTSYTFENPGNYNVVLTVTDAQGLTDTASITISVNQEITDTTDCVTNGGLSGDEGLKQWCWSDLEQEVNSAGAQSGFSNNQLAKSVHYNANGVFAQNGRLNFRLNPNNSSSSNNNYRQEIRDNPASVRHPLGTEQWWGFDYRFGDDYIADELPWIMWQTHGYFNSPADPMTALELAPSNYLGNSNPRGELFISNAAFSSENPKKIRTGIVPRAGQTLRIVIQMVWGDNNNGLFKVWIDDVLVYNEQERTVYAEKPEGGYWKIGIYKWRWRQQSNVNSSQALGINELNTSIGALRVIKKSPSNSTYLANEFNTVKPK
ncbi:PKD domain-containing protein [Maribacter sp. 2308TA10-17]|uniref:PKD domain-containing protein n=1 Tax=Maribacter sp. 2308TA10-17 TaxID=3386276 RepID=UPI0039BD81F5